MRKTASVVADALWKQEIAKWGQCTMDIGMTEHARPILTMDGYQLVALTQDHTYDPDRIIAYVVTTMSGARLHHARTMEEARSWMERQEEGQVARSEEHTSELQTLMRITNAGL